MIEDRLSAEMNANLVDLRRETLRVLAIVTGAVSYLLWILVVYAPTREAAPEEAWIGAGVLAVSVTASYLLRERSLRLASVLLVVGVMVSISCIMLAFPLLDLAYLLVIPVAFASILLGPFIMMIVAVSAILLVALISTLKLGMALLSLHTLLPLVVIAMITIASFLSEHNLLTALIWVWTGYERARHNEGMLRERSAELRQALKSLDEATYRLERTNQMLALAREQADEARKLKQQFAQTISHELRTPLNLIVAFTELMVRSPETYGEPLPTSYVRDLSTVHRNARHLQNLIDDVLDLARIEAAQMSLVLEDTDPALLVQEAASTVYSLVTSRGLELRTEIGPNLPRLHVDPTRIRQVLFNLLNNAARFTEQGSVTVSVRREGQEVVFCVTDTGVGIAPQDIPRIFIEFQQLDSGTRRRYGGAGLGLAISKGFVELHGGRVWVESTLGVGSTFSFALPVQHMGQEPLPGDLPRARRLVAARQIEEEYILLAITHSLAAAGMLTRYVKGARTIVAHDLKQAQEMAQELLPQAILIDVASFDTHQVDLETLAEQFRLPGVPLIACPLPGERSACQDLAVDGYLIKPFSVEGLWDVLRPFGENINEVLVVDDDKEFVRLMNRMLDNPVRRYDVISAYTGLEALEILHRRVPDLLLLDLGLPDVDGLQIIGQVRSEPQLQHLPLIVISGQEQAASSRLLKGNVSITKVDGLVPGEVLEWVQKVVDTATSMRHPTASEPVRSAG